MRHYQRAEVGLVHMLRGAVEHVEDLAQEVLLVAHCGWMAKAQERLAHAMMVRQGSYQGWGMS